MAGQPFDIASTVDGMRKRRASTKRTKSNIQFDEIVEAARARAERFKDAPPNSHVIAPGEVITYIGDMETSGLRLTRDVVQAVVGHAGRYTYKMIAPRGSVIAATSIVPQS